MPKSKDILTNQEIDDIQQPISKTGYVNERFNKLYGKDKNPYTGTERDVDTTHVKSLVIGGPADWLVKREIERLKTTKGKERKQIIAWLKKYGGIELK